MKDSLLIQTAAMPNAANTVNTTPIALPQQVKRPFDRDFRVRLYNTQATGANSKNINYTLYGSNESNGANAVAHPGVFTVAGNAANHPASNREIAIQPNFDKGYLFVSATGEANGGNAADGTFGMEIII
jgi:hypothetical protein